MKFLHEEKVKFGLSQLSWLKIGTCFVVYAVWREKKCLHYKRLGTTGHLVKLQQWNWMCKVWGLVIFDKAPGTLILTVMNMHNSHWWNQVLSSHEWEVPFICPVLLHIWHWNDHSPITHNLYDSSEVKKEGEADFLS